MKYLFAFLLLFSTANAESFNCWVGEDWKTNVDGWTMLVHDASGTLAGKDVAAVESDLGGNAGATITGTIDTSATLNQSVNVFFIETATNYVATSKAYYLDGSGNIGVSPVDASSAWDALMANHVIADSFGEHVQNLDTSTSDPAVIAEAVWDFLTANANEPGSFGEMIQNIWTTVQTLTNEADFAAPDNIAQSRTLFISGSMSTSIVSLNAWTGGVVTIANDCDNANTLNPGTTIASITSATVTPDAGGNAIPTSDLRVQQNKRKCNFSVDPINTAGWYTATTVFVTSDGQTLTVAGKIEVR